MYLYTYTASCCPWRSLKSCIYSYIHTYIHTYIARVVMLHMNHAWYQLLLCNSGRQRRT